MNKKNIKIIVKMLGCFAGAAAFGGPIGSVIGTLFGNAFGDVIGNVVNESLKATLDDSLEGVLQAGSSVLSNITSDALKDIVQSKGVEKNHDLQKALLIAVKRVLADKQNILKSKMGEGKFNLEYREYFDKWINNLSKSESDSVLLDNLLHADMSNDSLLIDIQNDDMSENSWRHIENILNKSCNWSAFPRELDELKKELKVDFLKKLNFEFLQVLKNPDYERSWIAFQYSTISNFSASLKSLNNKMDNSLDDMDLILEKIDLISSNWNDLSGLFNRIMEMQSENKRSLEGIEALLAKIGISNDRKLEEILRILKDEILGTLKKAGYDIQSVGGLEKPDRDYHYQFWKKSNDHLNIIAKYHSTGISLLEQHIMIDSRNLYEMDKLMDELNSGHLGKKRNLLIYGEGGIGKTIHTIYYWQKNQGGSYSGDKPVCLYVNARRINEVTLTENDFIRREILKNLCFEMPRGTNIDAFFYNSIFTGTLNNGLPKYVILIDGIDEAGEDSQKKNRIFKEVEDIILHNQDHPSVSIVMTSRVNFIGLLHDNISGHFTVGEMQPLTDVIIRNYLSNEYGSISPRHIKLLSNPFYLKMYSTIMSDGGTGKSAISYSSGNSYLMYREKPSTPGELIWNYMMKQLEKEIERYGTFKVPSVYNKYVVLFLMLPYIAYKYMEQGSMQDYEFQELAEEFLKGMKRYMNRWYSFWDKSLRPIEYCKIDTIDWEFIKTVVTESIPLIRFEDGEIYFLHQIYLDYFNAIYRTNLFNLVVIGIDPGEDAPIWQPIQPYLLKFIGEICGETHNPPYVDHENKKWILSSEYRDQLLERALDKMRGKSGKSEQMCVYNIYEAIKLTRCTEGGYPDMSGMNLTKLDMSRCSISNVIFSRFYGSNYLCADFSGCLIDEKYFFSSGHSAAVVSILPMEEENKLVSVDTRGDVIVWDLNFNRPIDKLNLHDFINVSRDNPYITNLAAGKENTAYVVCNDCIMHLDLFPLHVRADETVYIPGVSIIHVGYDKDGVFYYTGDTPLTRRYISGPVMDDRDYWSYETAVSTDGKTGFRLANYNFYNLDSLQKFVLSDGRWEGTKTILKSPYFRASKQNTGKIRMSGDDKILMLAMGNGRVMEFDTDICNQVRSYQLHTGKSRINDIRTMGEFKRVVAANNDIYIIDLERGIQIKLAGCYNSVSQCIFNMDSETFFVFTRKSPTVQIFNRDNSCLGSFIVEGINNIHSAALAFNFSEEPMSYDKFGPTGLIGKYPERVRLLCLTKSSGKSTIVEVDPNYGAGFEGIDKNTEIIPFLKVSLDKDKSGKVYLSWSGNSVRQMMFSPDSGAENKAASEFSSHPEWLITQCNFIGIKGISESMKAILKNYTDRI